MAGCVHTNMGSAAHLSIVFYSSSKKHGLGGRKVAAVGDGGGEAVKNEVAVRILGAVRDALELEKARGLSGILGLGHSDWRMMDEQCGAAGLAMRGSRSRWSRSRRRGRTDER